MLTDEDIKKLVQVFATKQDVHEIVSNLASKEDIHEIMSSIDAFAKKTETFQSELIAMKSAINRHEEWIRAKS